MRRVIADSFRQAQPMGSPALLEGSVWPAAFVARGMGANKSAWRMLNYPAAFLSGNPRAGRVFVGLDWYGAQVCGMEPGVKRELSDWRVRPLDSAI